MPVNILKGFNCFLKCWIQKLQASSYQKYITKFGGLITPICYWGQVLALVAFRTLWLRTLAKQHIRQGKKPISKPFFERVKFSLIACISPLGAPRAPTVVVLVVLLLTHQLCFNGISDSSSEGNMDTHTHTHTRTWAHTLTKELTWSRKCFVRTLKYTEELFGRAPPSPFNAAVS